MVKSKLRIATRKSPLALWQANFVKQAVESAHTEIRVELIPMSTRGDKLLDSPLSKIGGKALFVKELENAILSDHADIAVHSMKDVPMDLPEGLALAAICEREDPSDAFVSNNYEKIGDLPNQAKVGTSSFRRQCQLKNLRSDLNICDLRGNVGTRLEKLDKGEYDAIILASAGLIRLRLDERIRSRLPFELSLPAGGQGAIGIECRTDDVKTISIVNDLHHKSTAIRVSAERVVNKVLQGGCQVPIASYAELHDDRLWLRALVGTLDGSHIIRSEYTDHPGRSKEIGLKVAENLLFQGAEEILEALGAR
ncbi:MAG: hydroxymethylbilane synthase [Gammaproteobacteria bacterium]|nr:hydroxymethylbilane synthase [Gammaproteobacteria bacterium]